MTTINEYVMENLIYCHKTHSFTHRLWNEWKKKMPKNKLEAQESAWRIVGEMSKEERGEK